jgi:hypothetical protein
LRAIKAPPFGTKYEPLEIDSKDGGEPMLSHKFNIGDIVALKPAIKRNILGGIYQVTKQLPENQGELE